MGDQFSDSLALQENGEEGLDDDMGVGGAAAEDAEAEFIRNVCEKDVVTGKGVACYCAISLRINAHAA